MIKTLLSLFVWFFFGLGLMGPVVVIMRIHPDQTGAILLVLMSCFLASATILYLLISQRFRGR
jgi:hypothetical protein